jgi:hypothetical protein
MIPLVKMLALFDAHMLLILIHVSDEALDKKGSGVVVKEPWVALCGFKRWEFIGSIPTIIKLSCLYSEMDRGRESSQIRNKSHSLVVGNKYWS